MAGLHGWGKLKVEGYGKIIQQASERVQQTISDLASGRGSREIVLSAKSSLESLLLEEEVYWKSSILESVGSNGGIKIQMVPSSSFLLKAGQYTFEVGG